MAEKARQELGMYQLEPAIKSSDTGKDKDALVTLMAQREVKGGALPFGWYV
ncbi:hypothetical protein [Pseudoalteromonas sp. S1688]|uniref:hypothetical protein n=1 Tax=Pseudoalteromonas sp. S1688 TaxID=579511 RepID=UPI002017C713|nr:hypothetical protein [Pseudoalteromonas sp. S1688]